MKRIVVGLMAVCLLGSLTVLAEEKTTFEKTVRKEVTLQEIAATGKLAKLTVDYTVTEVTRSSPISILCAGMNFEASGLYSNLWHLSGFSASGVISR